MSKHLQNGKTVENDPRLPEQTRRPSKDTPIAWKIPYDRETKTITTISMDNVRTRKIIDGMGQILIPLCITDSEERSIWLSCIQDYVDGKKILLKHENLTNEEIITFQWFMDKFANQWATINKGNEGFTNYIHLLASGHIYDYLMEWRSLYRYSQQGWEALNNAVKKFFFRRTNRGGGIGNNNRLTAVARWLSRRFVWMVDVDYETIQKKLCEINSTAVDTIFNENDNALYDSDDE